MRSILLPSFFRDGAKLGSGSGLEAQTRRLGLLSLSLNLGRSKIRLQQASILKILVHMNFRLETGIDHQSSE